MRLERLRAPSCQGQFLKGGYTGETITWNLIINTWKMYIPSLQFGISCKFIEYQCNLSKENHRGLSCKDFVYINCVVKKLLSSPDPNSYWLVDMKATIGSIATESYQAMVKPLNSTSITTNLHHLIIRQGSWRWSLSWNLTTVSLLVGVTPPNFDIDTKNYGLESRKMYVYSCKHGYFGYLCEISGG